MRRKHWVIPITTGAAAAVLLTLWVRSYWSIDYPQVQFGGCGAGYYSTGGSARISIYYGHGLDERRVRWEVLPGGGRAVLNDDALFHVLGFSIDTGGQGPWHFHGVVLPYWFLTAVAVATCTLATRRAMRHLRAERAQSHRCVVCGYDLRATPERCPECGTAVERESTAKAPAPAAVQANVSIR